MRFLGRFRRAWAVVLAAGLIAGGCATVAVHTERDPSVDFSGYRHYAWKKPPDSGSALLDRRVVAAVDTQLSARGWVTVPLDRAQLALAAVVATVEQQRIDTQHPDWGRTWQGWGSAGPVRASAAIATYRVGTLVIDLYDTRSMNVIWRGSASKALGGAPDEVGRAVDEAVRKMFAAFPGAAR